MSSPEELEADVAPLPPKTTSHETPVQQENTGGVSSGTIQQSEPGTRRNRNRRAMAWVALSTMLIFTLLLWFAVPIERVNALEEPVVWFYIVEMGIIFAYMGFTTLPSLFNRGR